LAVDPMTNALQVFETLIRTIRMPLSANVHPHSNYLSHFLFICYCLPQSFDVRMPSFLSYYWIPAL